MGHIDVNVKLAILVMEIFAPVSILVKTILLNILSFKSIGSYKDVC